MRKIVIVELKQIYWYATGFMCYACFYLKKTVQNKNNSSAKR